jgi:hypothetical protein
VRSDEADLSSWGERLSDPLASAQRRREGGPTPGQKGGDARITTCLVGDPRPNGKSFFIRIWRYGTMHESLEKLPVRMEGSGARVRILGGWGGMAVGYGELPAGFDFRPLLEGLPDDRCHCPHWGYVLKGSARWRQADGSEEVVKAGDVFYAPAGHTVWIEEESAVLDFSPEKEFEEVYDHITKKVNEQS